jgi:hypothetical protein
MTDADKAGSTKLLNSEYSCQPTWPPLRKGIALPPIGERREDLRLARDRICDQQKTARATSGSIPSVG